MSRTFKFRAWDTENEETIYNIGLCPDGGIPYTSPSGASEPGEMDYYEGAEVMQFTGLTDTNGQDIYEGDIVRILYSDWLSKSDSDPRTLDEYLRDISRIGQIEFDESRFGIRFSPHGYLGPIHVGQHGRIEIIGNIYETPDMLND